MIVNAQIVIGKDIYVLLGLINNDNNLYYVGDLRLTKCQSQSVDMITLFNPGSNKIN